MEELYEGSTELRDGIEEYESEGIDKLVDLVDKDLQSFIDRLDLLREAGDSYQSYSGLADGQSGSVKFLIETGSIKAD